MGSNTQILHDLRILITGVSTNERGSLVKLAKHQGAVLLSAATANDPPHVVMTRRVGTPKYFATMRHRPSTPVVTPEWLNASVSAGKRLPYADFAAGPFQGLIVCFSGLPVQEKNRLAALVTSRGGKHSPSLSTECTHLVTVSKESDKYRFAQRHGIACLRPDWFEETVAKGWCQEEKAYAVETEPICAGATSSGQAAAAGSKRLREASAMPLNDEQSCGWTGVSGGGESRMPELSSKSLDAAPSGAARLLPSRLGRDAIGGNIPNVDVRGDGRSAMDAPGPPTSSAAEPSPAPWAALDWDDSNPRFLDACYVWPVACSTGESIEIQSLCAQSGAKRFTSPHPDLITHVIVGSLMEPSEADNVVKFITEQKRSVVTVSIEWLRRSVARREVLPADERFAITVRPTTLKIAPVSTLATRPNDITLDADGSFHGLEAQLQPSLLRQLSGPPSLQGGGLLEGCYFTLAALKGRADEAVAERLIRAHGGRLFTTRSVPAGARAFAICPASLTPAAALTLRPSHPDFAAVPETNRFTVYWLECCGLAGEILVAQRGTPCFQPLPYDLPLPGMNRVS
jgi:topoisomerase (DNA) II binding protein 1